MYKNELFQKIATTPGLTVTELAKCLGQPESSVRRKLNSLEKYDVIYTRPKPNPNPHGWSTVKSYYPLQSALKYKRE